MVVAEGYPNKRRRLNRETSISSATDLSDSDFGDDAVTEAVSEAVLTKLVGRVHRVRAKDFIVYKQMELLLSSDFNIIIGPNGTGKSSVVAAIFLGLGGSPSRLGSRKLHEYVRQGRSRAEIEIELKNEPSNLIINHHFKAHYTTGRQMGTWSMNGHSATHEEVVKTVSNLGIFVNNLCQFLPQERVAEFARESPQERLKSTLRAIDPDLLTTHLQLISLGKELSDMHSNVSASKREFERLEKRYKDRQEIIDKIQEREDTMEKMASAEHALRIQEIFGLEAEIQEIRSSIATTRSKMKQLANFNQNLNEIVQSRKRDIAESKAKREKLAKEETDISKAISKISVKLLSLTQSTATFFQSIENEEAKKKSQEVGISALQQKLSMRKKNLEEMRQKEQDKSVGELKEQIHALNESRTVLVGRKSTITDEMGATKRLLNQSNINLNKQLRHKESLQSKRHAREAVIKTMKNGPAILKACQLYLENKEIFEDKIYPPPILCVNLKDNKLLDQVCSSLVPDNMLTFLCTNRSDYNLFSDLMGKAGLNINVKEFSDATERRVSDFKRPIPQSVLQRAKIDGYIVDLLEGPVPVLCMLCHDSKIHEKLYCKDKMNPGVVKDLFGKLHITGQCADSVSVRTIKMAKFGSREAYTSDSRHYFALWKSAFKEGSDKKAIDECQKTIDDIKDESSRYSEQLEVNQNQLDAIVEELRPIEEERQGLINELKEVGRIEKQIAALELSITKFEDELKSLTEDQQKTSDNLEQLRAGSVKVARTDNTLLQKIEELLAKQSLNFESSIKVEFNLKTLANDLLIVETVRKRAGAELESRLAQLQDVEKHKQHQKQALEKGVHAVEDSEKFSQEFVDSARTMALEVPHDELCQLKAEYKAILDQDVGLVEKKDLLDLHMAEGEAIRQLTSKLDSLENDQHQKADEMESLLQSWRPKVQQCVENISTTFSRLFLKAGSAGRVDLVQGKHFDEWAIDIKVKFRDEDGSLSSLTAHRQSGGERAVTTMLYLISLQNFSSSPFRVVDEINQGMDKTFERLVHRLLVETSSATNSCQYVLVTPKLLPNLLYSDNTTVHCIYAGPFIGASQHGSQSFTSAMIERLEKAG